MIGIAAEVDGSLLLMIIW